MFTQKAKTVTLPSISPGVLTFFLEEGTQSFHFAEHEGIISSLEKVQAIIKADGGFKFGKAECWWMGHRQWVLQID